MITNESLENLKAQINILEIIGSYLELKRAGANYSACCPFHDEKTPSFMVSPSKNIFHCYGCGVGGDSIKFVMEYEKLNFVEAIEKIASIMNFTLEYSKNDYVKKSNVLEKINLFYQERLKDSPMHLDYLYKRGVTNDLIEEFNLGYCPESKENLQYINAHGLNYAELEQYGIIGKGAYGYYARFSERIIFPIYSPEGKILGFGGRTIKNDDKIAKYINSMQTKVFNKSKLLYGYHLAKQSIFSKAEIIITEGYLDVIMLHKAGFKNAVATLGTALTNEHIPLLNKGEPRIMVGYDGDKAGINAAIKASRILAPLSKYGGVVIFPNGADPADMIVQNKVKEVEEIFNNFIPFVDFVLKNIVEKFNLANPIDKQNALKEMDSFLSTLNPIVHNDFIPIVANMLNIPISFIPQVKKKTQKNAKNTYTQVESSGDKLEKLVIRYMLDDEKNLDLALKYIDSNIFIHFKDAFILLRENNIDNARIREIMIEDLPVVENGFKAELILLIQRYLENKQKRLTDFEEIAKNKQKLIKLKNGELVYYK